MLKIIIYLFTAILWLVVPALINKSTEARFDWIKPHLRKAWTAIFLIAPVVYLFTDNQLMEAMVKLHKTFPGFQGYVICFFIGGAVLCCVWWITGKAFNDAEISKPIPVLLTEPKSIIGQKQLTAEDRAGAVKKEIAPQSKSNEISKDPPDLTKAKQTLINSMDQFNPDFVMKLKDVSNIVPGYFELLADPVPSGGPYSSSVVTTKKQFSTHFYASVRLAALENVQTMDFMGRDIWVCVDPEWKAILIWETEQLQTPWLPIQVERFQGINTIAIYQKNKHVDIFVNNHYVRSYAKLRQPSSGPISIQIKANTLKGGKMFFRDFSVWDFGAK